MANVRQIGGKNEKRIDDRQALPTGKRSEKVGALQKVKYQTEKHQSDKAASKNKKN